MAIYRGTLFEATFQVSEGPENDPQPIDITGMTFEADFRASVEGDEIITINSAGGGFVIEDGPNGLLKVHVTKTETAQLPLGRILFDVHQTGDPDGPTWLFRVSDHVADSVTRDD